jgi:hypothetical protein
MHAPQCIPLSFIPLRRAQALRHNHKHLLSHHTAAAQSGPEPLVCSPDPLSRTRRRQRCQWRRQELGQPAVRLLPHAAQGQSHCPMWPEAQGRTSSAPHCSRQQARRPAQAVEHLQVAWARTCPAAETLRREEKQLHQRCSPGGLATCERGLACMGADGPGLLLCTRMAAILHDLHRERPVLFQSCCACIRAHIHLSQEAQQRQTRVITGGRAFCVGTCWCIHADGVPDGVATLVAPDGGKPGGGGVNTTPALPRANGDGITRPARGVPSRLLTVFTADGKQRTDRQRREWCCARRRVSALLKVAVRHESPQRSFRCCAMP